MPGVEKETGFTLGYDKYNWAAQEDHFILADCKETPGFGEGKQNMDALPGTAVLSVRDCSVQLAANGFGAGRAGCLSGLPDSIENARLLYRAILLAAHARVSPTGHPHSLPIHSPGLQAIGTAYARRRRL